MSVKSFLVLGAGRVSGPCVQYLLSEGHEVTIVDKEEGNLEKAAKFSTACKTIQGDAVSDASSFINCCKPDVVVSLLPARFLSQIAGICVAQGVHMVATSYVKPEIMALEPEAKRKDVSILCEMGLDPGIDHMSAAKTIGNIHARGGDVKSFWSVCGALPDLDSNTNPMGYKLSWAPESLIGASRRDARVMENGQVIEYRDGETYSHPSITEISGLGAFEVYANADSIAYIDAYQIPEAVEIYRGTLRYPGWSETVVAMNNLDLFAEDVRNFEGMTYADLMKRQVKEHNKGISAKEAVGNFLNMKPYMTVLARLEWLGLFDAESYVVPSCGSLRSVIGNLYGEKLIFGSDEHDLIAMEHRLKVFYPSEKRHSLYTSTLILHGDIDGQTAIARTTGTPAGIGAHLLATGRVKTRGILIPTLAEIYEPALQTLERLGISFIEKEERMEER